MTHRPEILNRLDMHARERPTSAAVTLVGRSGQTTLSWDTLAGAVHSFAARLKSPLAAGGCVLLATSSGPEFMTAYLATLAAGGTVFPLAAGLTGPEIAAASALASACAIVGDEEPLASMRGRGPVEIPAGEVLGAPPAASGSSGIGGALYLQSSGTTGAPRIARRTGASIDAVARNVAAAVRLTPGDTVLCAVPMSHSYGMENALLAPVWAGAHVRVLQSVDSASLRAELSSGTSTVMPLVPFMLELLAQSAGTASSALRLVYTAGSILPQAVRERFSGAWNLSVGQLYGATEIGSVTFSDPSAAGFDPGSVGAPMRDVEIRIVDPKALDIERPLAAGAEGHVAVRATSMLESYVDGPAPINKGYFLTGDLGKIDAAGSLTITGRLKLLIDVGGIKVNPLEVEGVLLTHPDVGDAVVLPMPVSATVSRICAVVTPRVGGARPSIDSLKEHVRQKLSATKVPRVIEVRDSLPKSPTGKILRAQVELPL